MHYGNRTQMDGEGLAGGAAPQGGICHAAGLYQRAAHCAHPGRSPHRRQNSIDKELFEELEHKIIGKPLIPKLRRSYTLPDGSVLEVNHVDEGQPTEFWYAEVEYPTVEAALAWQPESCGLGDYLKDEVTNQPGQSMGEYWVETRG